VATNRGRFTSTTLYRFYDSEWRLLYVGISWDVAARIGQHRDSKPWFEYVAFIRVDHYLTRAAAETAEQDTIREERPPFNTTAQNRYVREILTSARTSAHPPVAEDRIRRTRRSRSEKMAALVQMAGTGRIPTSAELAQKLGVTERMARYYLRDFRAGKVAP
jgi:predicted GIY-YIG superfamily endonuclease